MKDLDNHPSSETEHQNDESKPASEGRRKAFSKIAYASPIVAGLLFTKNAEVHAQSGGPPGPPPPPGG